MQSAYRALVGRDRAVSASEFWNLSPDEVWWLIEARQPPDPRAEVEAATQRASEYKSEAEEHGFQNVGDFWRWRARQGMAGHG